MIQMEKMPVGNGADGAEVVRWCREYTRF